MVLCGAVWCDTDSLSLSLSPSLSLSHSHDTKPRDIMTMEAFENAVRLVMVTGGSTNATIHLIAMARANGVDLKVCEYRFKRSFLITILLYSNGSTISWYSSKW